MRVLTPPVTLMDVAFPRKSLLRDAALVLGFSCLTALSAQISFWVGPVPITGQTFAVLLSGILLGSFRGTMSQLTYLAIGCTGIPYWFALGGVPGIARLLGPTGGYLIGFVAVAFVVGWLAERGWDRKVGTAALAMLIGNTVLYIFGLPWLSRFVPEGTVLQVGLYPFIPGDLLKLTLAALALPSAWYFVNRARK